LYRKAKNIQIYIKTDRETDRLADRYIGRQAGSPAGRQAERQTDRHTERQTSKYLPVLYCTVLMYSTVNAVCMYNIPIWY
jgi:hypothetical protein